MSSFAWTEGIQQSTENLNERLLSTPFLAFPDAKKNFILYRNASLTAMGAVLAQVQDGKEKATCCASNAFSKNSNKLFVKKREFLAIVKLKCIFKQ